MKHEKHDIIATDIAKSALQTQTATQAFQIANTSTGFAELSKRIHSCSNPIVVLEASGGYERDLLLYLNRRNIPAALLNPSRVRAFAQSEGIRAKTDPIDAKVIYRFAEEKKLAPTPKPDPARKRMADFLDRRSHLSEQLAREKNRLQNCPRAIAKSIQRMVRFVQKEIDAMDKRIGKLVEKRADLNALARAMTSVSGVGEMTAWTLIAYLDEITRLSRNKIVALAGLAPFNKDTGKSRGKRRIQGGRAKVRKCLYMAAITAATHNPVIKEYVDRLKERGKPHKCAIVAAMRKLLIHLQSQMKKTQLALEA